MFLKKRGIAGIAAIGITLVLVLLALQNLA